MSSADWPSYSMSSSRRDLSLPSGATYLYAAGTESRGRPPSTWLADCASHGVDLIELEANSDDFLSWHREGAGETTVNLRNSTSVDAFLLSLPAPLYLDITGLPINAWAPLIPRVRDLNLSFRVVYVEPKTYSRSQVPSPGKIFDLSERICGIAPVPSFANLRRPVRDQVALVPILGFEGARLEYVLQEAELPSEQVFPILGSPGFRLEYPTFALIGNADALVRDQLSQRLTLAKASCPFDLFMAVDKISRSSRAGHVRIAPLGTKPHALGAVLYATAARHRVDLLYDFAIPKPGMAEGSSTAWTYYVSEFMESPFFAGACT